MERLLYCLMGVLLLTASCDRDSVAGVRSPGRPNIVFVLVDDLGWQDTSVPMWTQRTPFQQHFRTPHIQRLAEQGICFTRAYSCAVCSPTRTSIMTGQNAARHRVTNWTFDSDRETSGRTNRLLPPRGWRREGLQPDQVTLPMMLKTVGYHTIHCGKAHWGARETAGADPTRLGFDINIAGHHAGAPGSYQGLDSFGNRSDDPSRQRWAVPGLSPYHGSDTHLTDALANEACAALESVVGRQQPFFLYLAPYAVHTPIQPHPRFIGNYLGRHYRGTPIPIPRAEANYASMVQGVDDAVGRILDKLDQLGVAENTVFVFTSDNGGLTVHGRGRTPRGTGSNTHCWPLREGKGSAYEGGIRVPLIVSWARPADNPLQRQLPIAPASRSAVPVICEDHFPTICRWAGVDLERALLQVSATLARPQQRLPINRIDGRDMTPAITGQGELKPRTLFFHYPHVWGPRGEGYQPHTSMIQGRHKLIYFYHARRWELYDLQTDIGEREELAARLPDRLEEMSRFMFGPEGLERFDPLFPETAPGIRYVPRPSTTHTAIQPAPGTETDAVAAGWTGGGDWLAQHRDINAMASSGGVDLVFLGDSLTQGWGGPGRNVAAVAEDIWQEFFASHRAANFGISGDRTQNLLWRIEHGNLDGIDPALIVVQIGTNNLSDNSVEEIAHGIEQVVLRLEESRSRARIVLMGILPRGREPDQPVRRKISEINDRIRLIADDRKTFFLDIGRQLLDDDGRARDSHFHGDHVHLTSRGYRAWAEAIQPLVERLMDRSSP